MQAPPAQGGAARTPPCRARRAHASERILPGGIPGHPEAPPRTSVTRPGSPRRSHGARIASRCGTTGSTVARSHRRGCTSIPDLSRLPARSISAYAA